MRRGWRSNRIVLFILSMLVCGGLLTLSIGGTLKPVEDLAAIPLNAVAGFFTRLALSATGGVTDFNELQNLRQRNAELEAALAQYAPELVELREIASDYQRLADLVNYTTARDDQEFVTADVINIDTSGALRTLVINRGARDGIAIGMPVVVRQGLIGRIDQVSAGAARVLLLTDQSSAVSARLQTSRELGSVVGQLSGNMQLQFVPIEATIQDGDLVLTSGLGGNFPPDLVIGQVVSVQQFQFDLYQTAEIRSLVNFDTLEVVLVITSFTPVDLSIFREEAQEGQ